MTQTAQHIVILGGGTAGWLTANILAAEFDPDTGVRVTLVESPNTPPIGVGEGTWPSMRSTLLKIGISETEFVKTCSATLKQGTRFENWVSGDGEIYYHPFSLPHGFSDLNLADYWNAGELGEGSFAECVTPQYAACERGLAPKQIQVPEYAFTLNYGYHLDAGKFADLLKTNAVTKLGVAHRLADVSAVHADTEGNISSLETSAGQITADFFVDCSGLSSLLIGGHYGVPLTSQRDTLFNDRALALQVPYADPTDAIATTTKATAHHAGWFWDIGLQHRRGVGAVFSSRHTDQTRVEQALRNYLRGTSTPADAIEESPRLIEFEPGYRHRFWEKNCVAIGLSAGFVEPLEASALVLVELSARRLAQYIPRLGDNMKKAAAAFNEEFIGRWQQIIEFLKLHYALSQRTDTDYWREHQSAGSMPGSLAEKLEDWRFRCPWHQDESRVDEMFPAASYQYVLYGMGFNSSAQPSIYRDAKARSQKAKSLFAEVQRQSHQFTQHLPPHRQLLDAVSARGFAERPSQ